MDEYYTLLDFLHSNKIAMRICLNIPKIDKNLWLSVDEETFVDYENATSFDDIDFTYASCVMLANDLKSCVDAKIEFSKDDIGCFLDIDVSADDLHAIISNDPDVTVICNELTERLNLKGGGFNEREESRDC
jgi:hypothetical protein